jgi:hypothetical protein
VNTLQEYCLSSSKATFKTNNSDVVAVGKWVKIDGKNYIDIVAVYPCKGKGILQTSEVEFSQLPGLATSITVFDENADRKFAPGSCREVSTTGGKFKDTFEDNDVHVYRIGPFALSEQKIYEDQEK